MAFPSVSLASTNIYKDKIHYYATKYGVNEDHMTQTIRCESGFNPLIKGDDGDSVGLVQISARWHPEISYAQATDVDFSLNFIAKSFADDKASMWSCWRMLYTHTLSK